jgi:NAD(P) transhydrogenase subunit alpha
VEESEPPLKSLSVGILRETAVGETRVALVPEDVAKLWNAGVEVIIESGAGESAFFSDEAYRNAGGRIDASSASFIGSLDILAMVRPPASVDTLQRLRPGAVVVGFLDPSRSLELIDQLNRGKVTAFAVELIPRITRAQSMDALSSMSTVAGYRAVLLAASASPRLFPMLITAAGTQPPCRVFVLGAGVAGLQALATAKRLGAITSGFDTRPEVREQVQSVGASFVQMDEELQVKGTAGGYATEVGDEFLARERQSIRPHVAQSDVVITTALIPGRPAPVLITQEMVASMKPGAVVVDLAGEAGGNCELTRAGETVVENGVTIVGPVNLPGQAASQSSQMYSRNIFNFIGLLVKDGHLNIEFEDEIIKAACLTRPGG